jgi:O-antigen/teichoic acid export membrane protein
MSTLRKNTFANYFGYAWGIISVFLFVPLYLKFLGIEAYGLIGFYSTLLAILVFADMGLTATLSREMARLSVRENAAVEMGELARTYESIYLCISLTVVALIWFFAPLIAERWLRASTLSAREISSVIRLMGIAISLQLPAGLYSGGLMGLQKQVLANFLQIAWGLLRGVGAVLLLWLVSPTLQAFAFWQILSNATYCFAVRLTLWHSLPSSDSKPRFNPSVFRGTWRYAAGMAGMAFFSTILLQTDKLIVSKMLPLETFGYYTLAGSLGMAPMILASPIGVALFPRLTGLVSTGDKDTLSGLYHKACRLASVAVIPGALTLALFAGQFIFAWTGSVVAAEHAGLVASLLLGAQTLNALTVVPYYLALAHGQTKIILQVQLLSIVIITSLCIVLINKYGILGGGISSLAMNLIIFPLYMFLLHRRLLPGGLKNWLLRDLARSLFASLPLILLSRWLLPSASSRMTAFVLIGLVWCASAAAAAFAMPELRSEFFRRTAKLFASS